MKYSVKRLNQLGYFKPLEEGQGIDVQKTPNEKNQVDVTLKLEEQNRNQLTFGAGVSQFEGFFGQLSFQTSNFLGRGEALTRVAAGRVALGELPGRVHEPFLFDRNITGGVDVYKRTLRYIDQFTQEATGGNVTAASRWPASRACSCATATRRVTVSDLNPIYYAPELVQRNPYLRDSLLLGEGGQRTISKVTPSFVHNTVDNPIFPNSGKRLTGSIDFAGLGGNTNFIKPRVRVRALPAAQPPHVGRLPHADRIHPAVCGTTYLPITETLYLGGEYTIRGFDIRSIGPRDPEYRPGARRQQDAAVQRRVPDQHRRPGAPGAVLRHRPGARHRRELRVEGRHHRVGRSRAAADHRSVLVHAAGQSECAATIRAKIGETNAFKTSTGAEIRFFMPVLNVPFRLIFAYNPSRFGVLDNNLRPAQKFTFKFAVGSTF